jgi:homoserine dehydrogenase
LKSGKNVITANKAMIAAQGVSLARLAERVDRQLSFEAAVCGGIPLLKSIREGLSANRFSSVRGVLNGTSNYILTRMHDVGLAFDEALEEAQHEGYTEADPAADIDGFDAANKLCILAALAFGAEPHLDGVFVEGIRHIMPADIRDAAKRGGRIKLLGVATHTDRAIVQRVHPVFVPLNEPLARVEGVANGIDVTGDFIGRLFIEGIGAGGPATASAVVADLVDLACGRRNRPFGVETKALTRLQ